MQPTAIRRWPRRYNVGEVERITVESIPIVVGREEDRRWWADIESMPGVMAYGATRESAIAAVRALALRVAADCIDHGEDIPEPFTKGRPWAARGDSQFDSLAISASSPGPSFGERLGNIFTVIEQQHVDARARCSSRVVPTIRHHPRHRLYRPTIDGPSSRPTTIGMDSCYPLHLTYIVSARPSTNGGRLHGRLCSSVLLDSCVEEDVGF